MKCRNCKNNTLREEEDGHQFSWCEVAHDNLDIDEERECCAYKPATHEQQIRAMSRVELARLLASNADCHECRIYSYKDGCMESYDTCVCQWLDWLQQEAT